MFVCLVSLLATEALVPILQPQHFGTVYRVFRLVEFAVALWLLTPWWGRRDLLLVRCHITALSGNPSLSAGRACWQHPAGLLGSGRLSGVLWDILPTQVAHYAAVITGLVISFSGSAADCAAGSTVLIVVLDRNRPAPDAYA